MDTDKYISRAVELIRRRVVDDSNWAIVSAVPKEDWFRTVSVAFHIFPIFVSSRALTSVEALLVESMRPTWDERLVLSGGQWGRRLVTLNDDPREVLRVGLTPDLNLEVFRRGDPIDVWGPEFASEPPDSKVGSKAGLTWRWRDVDGNTAFYVYYNADSWDYRLDRLADVQYPEGESYQTFKTPEEAFDFVKRLRGVNLHPRKPDWRPA